MNELELSALDGANPLGFLAALGTLAVLSETDPQIRLGWRARARWVPYLCSPDLQGDEGKKRQDVQQRLATRLRGKPVDGEKERVREAAQRQFNSAKTQRKKADEGFKKLGLPARSKEWSAAREKDVVPFEKAFTNAREVRNNALKESVPSAELALGERPDCTIEEFRERARTMTMEASSTERVVLDMMASLGAELSDRNDERITPTPFSFVNGSGKQWFLDTARQLMTRKNPTQVEPTPTPCVTEANLRRCLFEAWKYQDEGLSMRWDPIEDSRYALRLDDPGPIGSYTVWMANLLGYVALAFFPCAPTSRGSATACWVNTEDAPRFRWPLWFSPLSANSVRSLLTHASLASADDESSTRELRARGIAAVFACRRLRNGKFTNFSPSTAA
ncbi:MAG TPA: hypothetical protein VK327_01330 [Candidatus Paceibacterota bacterium]|nr:hypothetical protein [Candidatus Paceibacterota bacterium]